MQTILVTGGLGYIGSHICIELLNNNFNVIVIDNLVNSSIDVLENIKTITDSDNILHFNIDLLDKDIVYSVFKENTIDGIIHCAGLKSVNESIALPLKYYNENINITLNLLEIINDFPIKTFVFSSSATVYGNVDKIFVETDNIGKHITNPYGETKYIQEIILRDYALQHKDISFIMLRYFNPIGNHSSGLIGDNPKGIPNNLMPYLLRVASNTYSCLSIYGNDYNTPDGTCIRDFIHVCDVAKAHIKTLITSNELRENIGNYNVYNIGTGKGCSVLELINTFHKVNKVLVNYEFKGKREGDAPIVLCDVSKAKKELDWIAEYTIEDMVRDSWSYIQNNKI